MTVDGVSKIFKIQEMQSYDRGPGRRSWTLVTPEVGSRHLTTGITEFQPGAFLDLHIHNCEEQITILEGDAVAIIDGTEYELTVPDTTFVSAGIPHRFINRSKKPMKILWIYADTNVTRTYVATGRTERQLEK